MSTRKRDCRTVLADCKHRSGKSFADIAKDTQLSRSFIKLVLDGGSCPSRASAFFIAKSLGMTASEAETCFLHWSDHLRAEVRTWDYLIEEYAKDCAQAIEAKVTR